MAYLQPLGCFHHGAATRLLACAGVALVMAACAKPGGQASLLRDSPALKSFAQSDERPGQNANPLHAATTHWAEQHRRNPQDPRAAVAYAQNLKAIGSNERAMQVLQTAHRHNPRDAQIASELGRLALEMDNLGVARPMLAQAERASRRPDWRVLSAQGTLHAKLGENEQAQRYFLAALRQKPDSASLLNNLAMSYALEGKADEAEKLLRRAIAQGGDTPRVRQNLALVLGLQGRFDEGQQLARADLPGEQADSNMTYLRNMVRQQPAAVASATPARTQAAEAVTATPATPARAPRPNPAPGRGWTATVAQDSR